MAICSLCLIIKFFQICNLEVSPKTSRVDLYERHYLSCHSSLDNLPEKHVCKNLWRIIKANKAGIVQEQFLALKLPLVLWQ